MKNIINNILDFTGGEKFYRFGNADGKFWIMPARGMRTAMNLYQPSGSKGKMMKRLFPLLHRLTQVQRVIHAQVLHCQLKRELHEFLCKLFKVDDLEFSIFEGTPSVHQKITMQLSSGRRILGYCKLSDNEDVKLLFAKESTTLDWLAAKGVENIPGSLFCGTMDCCVHIFVQSTVKSDSSHVVHEWSKLHEEFIALLHERTKQRITFEESDYYKTLQALEEHLDWLPGYIDGKHIRQAIETVRNNYKGQEVEFSAYHGDFTPWNMFVERGRLFVFDFEYAAKSYPPGLDRYHFLTQTAIFEKKWSAKDVAMYMNAGYGEWIDKKSYIMYLLDVVSRFTSREGGKVEGNAAAPFALWGELLEYLMVIRNSTPPV